MLGKKCSFRMHVSPADSRCLFCSHLRRSSLWVTDFKFVDFPGDFFLPTNLHVNPEGWEMLDELPSGSLGETRPSEIRWFPMFNDNYHNNYLKPRQPLHKTFKDSHCKVGMTVEIIL